MRLTIYIVLVLAIAMVLAIAAVQDPGYALLVRPPWSVEMPLTLFALMLLLAFIALYLLGRVVTHLLHIPRGMSLWQSRRRSEKAREALTEGLTHLAMGEWLKAEFDLKASLANSQAPLINYLALAMAAQGRGDRAKRDDYLAQAHAAIPENALAIGMTQGLLQALAGQREQALATLSELRQQAPDHKYVLKLLADIYVELKDWAELGYLLPDLRKHKTIDAKRLEALEVKVHQELLKPALPSGSLSILRRAWEAVPDHLKENAELLAIYTRQLILQRQYDEAETLLRQAIGHEWNENLVALYGLAHSTGIRRQFDTALRWRQNHGTSPALHLALGRLAMANGANDDALGYLQRALELGANTEAHLELGRALERLGRIDDAMARYRLGLETVTGKS
jgi:HemY protein